MQRKTYVWREEWTEAIKDLEPLIRLEIREAVDVYALFGISPTLKTVSKIAFNFIKTGVDRDIEKYISTTERNRENGKKGGRPKNPKNPKNPSGFSENPNKPKKPDSDNDNDNTSNEVLIEELDKSNSLSDGKPPNDAKTKESDFEINDFESLITWFNSETNGIFGNVKYPISEKRKSMVRARIREHGKKVFALVVKTACESDFLRGQNKSSFTATFDWLIKPSNFEKILSGNYSNKENYDEQSQYKKLN